MNFFAIWFLAVALLVAGNRISSAIEAHAGAVEAAALAPDAVTGGAILDGSVSISDIGFDHGDDEGQ